MLLRSRLAATAVAAIPLLALVAGPATTLAADPPVTLRFAVADGDSSPSSAYVRAFLQEVAVRSGGSVTLDPIWTAGGDDFEQGVTRMLVAGDADVALAAGRGWSTAGVSSLDALQAPFLITDDALAAAVATSPTATAMLDGMTSGGAVGLALWPEDLRHPVAWESCMPPITAPEQLQGMTVRAIPSGVTLEMLTALGANQVFVDNYASLVESCEIQAAESGLRQGASLPGTPTFTGDVTFFPKFQVLAVSAAAFDQLTPAQQTAVREGAIAVRDQAIAEHPSEADAAAAWCADGGRVVLAGPDAVAAFQAAAQPVFDRMAADPVSGSAIEAIAQLAATVSPCPRRHRVRPGRVSQPGSERSRDRLACPRFRGRPDPRRHVPDLGDQGRAAGSGWLRCLRAGERRCRVDAVDRRRPMDGVDAARHQYRRLRRRCPDRRWPGAAAAHHGRPWLRHGLRPAVASRARWRRAQADRRRR